MSFYTKQYPALGDITICTVTSYDPNSGFTVHMDEYDDNGFMMSKELSTKYIRKSIASFLKIGTQLPLEVVDINDTYVSLSKKRVSSQDKKVATHRYELNRKLFGLCRRLDSFTDITTERWAALFRSLTDDWDGENDEHPYTLISNREPLEFDEKMSTVIENNHAKLFGIKPITRRSDITVHSFGIHGMDTVKNELIKIRDLYIPPAETSQQVWSDQQLYESYEFANVQILPLAMPKFQVSVTAYQRARCDQILNDVKVALMDVGFDHCSMTFTSDDKL